MLAWLLMCCLPAWLLCVCVCICGGVVCRYEMFTCYLGKGDKETFAYAMAAVGEPYTLVRTPPRAIGTTGEPLMWRWLQPHTVKGALTISFAALGSRCLGAGDGVCCCSITHTPSSTALVGNM